MPNVAVVFNAETGQFVSNVDGMDKAVARASDRVAQAKNSILQWGQSSIQAAKEAGASSEQLASIQERTAQRLASVTEQNATRQINALDRLSAKQKAVAAEMANLNKVVDISTGRSMTDEFTERQRSAAVVRALSGRSGLRTGEAFASAIPGFSALSEAIFPVAGAIAFGTVVAEGVSHLKDMYETAKELPDTIRQGFEALNAPIELNVDTLRKDNDQLEITIAHLEHKPANTLALALDEARINADKLAESSRKAFDDVTKLLKQNHVSFADYVLTGQLGSGVEDDEIKKRMQAIADLQQANKDALRSGHDSPEAAQTRAAQIRKSYQDLYTWAHGERTGIQSFDNGQARGLINTLEGVENYAADTLDEQDQQSRNTSDQGKAKKLQGAKQAAEDAKRASAQALENIKSSFEKLKDDFGVIAPESALAFWQGFTNSSNDKVAKYAREQAHTFADAFEKGLHEHNPLITAFLKQQKELANLRAPEQPRSDVFGNTRESSAQLSNAYSRSRMESILQDAQQRREQVQIALSQGRLSKSASDKQLADITKGEHDARIVELQTQIEQFQKTANTWNPLTQMYGSDREQSQYVGLTTQLAKEKSQAVIDAMKDAAQESADSWRGAWGDTFRLWVQDATDSAKQVAGLFKQGIDGVNENLVNLMSGDYKRGDFKRAGHDLFKSAAGSTLQHVEGSIFGKLGTKSNPIYTRSADAVGGSAGAKSGNLLAGLKLPNIGSTGSSDGTDNTGDGEQPSGFKKVLGGIFGSIAGIFGGARAVGGGVSAGQVYRINENGQEYFQPSVDGKIIPHGTSTSSGGNVFYTVHVANGVTPEQMNMHVRAALQEYHPQGVHAAVKAVHDHQQRRAPSAR